jgi:hypothetical protein
VAQGLQRSGNDCLDKEDTNYKMKRPLHIRLISPTAKIIAKILRSRTGKKFEDILGEDQFGFIRGKVTRNAIGMMRIIAERTWERNCVFVS